MSAIDAADERRRLSRWLSTPAAVVYCVIAAELYGVAGEPEGLPAFVAFVVDCLFISSVALWVVRDAAEAGRPLPYDSASFLFVGWPLVLMIYLLGRHRLRGLGIIGRALLLMLLGAAAVRLPLAIVKLYVE